MFSSLYHFSSKTIIDGSSHYVGIVELHKNGKIWAESEGEGFGCTFFVHLPLHSHHYVAPGRNVISNSNSYDLMAALSSSESSPSDSSPLVASTRSTTTTDESSSTKPTHDRTSSEAESRTNKAGRGEDGAGGAEGGEDAAVDDGRTDNNGSEELKEDRKTNKEKQLMSDPSKAHQLNAIIPALQPTSAAVDDAWKPTILVVDDSAMNRKMLVRMLVSKGFACREAEDGLEGLSEMSRMNLQSAYTFNPFAGTISHTETCFLLFFFIILFLLPLYIYFAVSHRLTYYPVIIRYS